MRSPKVKSDLRSLKSLMIRRENASLRGKRPVRHIPLLASKLPSITPDWILKPGQPREFDDPMCAIITLLARLDMQPEK